MVFVDREGVLVSVFVLLVSLRVVLFMTEFSWENANLLFFSSKTISNRSWTKARFLRRQLAPWEYQEYTQCTSISERL